MFYSGIGNWVMRVLGCVEKHCSAGLSRVFVGSVLCFRYRTKVKSYDFLKHFIAFSECPSFRIDPTGCL